MLIGIIIALMLVLIFIWFKQGIYEFAGYRKPQHGSWQQYIAPQAIGNELLKSDVTGNVGFEIYSEMDALSGYIDDYYAWVVAKYRIPKFVQNLLPLPDSDPNATNRNEFVIQTGLKLDFVNELLPAYASLVEIIMKSPNFTLQPNHIENYNLFTPWSDRYNFWVALTIMVRFKPTRLLGTGYQGLLTVGKNSGFADSNLLYNFLSDTDDAHTPQRVAPIAQLLGLDFSSYTPGTPALPTDPDRNNVIYAAACRYWSRIVDVDNADNFTVYGINLKGIGVLYELDKCGTANDYQCTVQNVHLYPQRQALPKLVQQQNTQTTQWTPQVRATLYNMPESYDFCSNASDFLDSCSDTEGYLEVCGNLDFDNKQCATTNKQLAQQWATLPKNFNEFLSISGQQGVYGQMIYEQEMATACDPTMRAVAECGSKIVNSDCGSIFPTLTCANAGLQIDKAMGDIMYESTLPDHITPIFGADNITEYCQLQTTVDDNGELCTNLNPLDVDCNYVDAMDELEGIHDAYMNAKFNGISDYNSVHGEGAGLAIYGNICRSINDFNDKWADSPPRQNPVVEGIFEDMNCYSDTCLDWWATNATAWNNYRDGSMGIYALQGDTDTNLNVELNRADFCDMWYSGYTQCGYGHEADFNDASHNVCNDQNGTCMRHQAYMDYAMRQWALSAPQYGYSDAAEMYCSHYNASVAAGCNPGTAAIDCTVPDFTAYMHSNPPPSAPQPAHPTTLQTWTGETVGANGTPVINPSPFLHSSETSYPMAYNINNDPFRNWITMYDSAVSHWNTSDPKLDALDRSYKQWTALEDLDITRGGEMGNYYFQFLTNYRKMAADRAAGTTSYIDINDDGLEYDAAIHAAAGSCSQYENIYKPEWGALAEYESGCDTTVPSLPHLQYLHYTYLRDQFQYGYPYTYPNTPNTSLKNLCTYYQSYKSANGPVDVIEQDCANMQCTIDNNTFQSTWGAAQATRTYNGKQSNMFQVVAPDAGWNPSYGDTWSSNNVGQTMRDLCQSYTDAVANCELAPSSNYSSLDAICPNIQQILDLHPVNVARAQYQNAQVQPHTDVLDPFLAYVNAYQSYKAVHGTLDPYETETSGATCKEAQYMITGVYAWNGDQQNWNRPLDDINYALSMMSGYATTYNDGAVDKFTLYDQYANAFLDAYNNHYVQACGNTADYDALVDQYNRLEALHALYVKYLSGQTGGAWASQLSTQQTMVAKQFLQNMPAVCQTYNTYKAKWGTDATLDAACQTWQHDGIYALIQSQYNDWNRSAAANGGAISDDTPVQTYYTQYKPTWNSDSGFDQMTQTIKSSNLVRYKNASPYVDAINSWNQAQNSSTVINPGSQQSDYDWHMTDFSNALLGQCQPWYQSNITPYGVTDSDISRYIGLAQCYVDQKNLSGFKAQYDSTYNSKYAAGVAAGQYTQKQVNLYYMMPTMKQMCPPYRDYKSRACAPTLSQDTWYDQQCSSVGL